MDPVKITGVIDYYSSALSISIITLSSHHAHTLFDLIMKDVRFNWGLPQEDSMKLKELVTWALVLVIPDNDLPFQLEADGFGIATSTVLF
jgi:hypothetical protein